MLRMMPALAAAFLCAGTASCAGRANGSPDPEWDLEGVIAAVEPGPAQTRVTVEVAPGAAAEGGPAVLLVSADTEVEVRRGDGSTRRGTAADLVAGARIMARHTGAQMRSLPPQYQATHVRIVLPS